MIRFACECGRELQAGDEHAGKKVRCPACGMVIGVPGVETVVAGDAVETGAEEPRSERVQASARPRLNTEEEIQQRPRGRTARDEFQAPAETSGKATTSLVLGILAFLCGFSCLTGLPAILLGVLALGDVKKSRGRVGGSGLAIAGIVLGSVGTLIFPVMVGLLLPAVQKVREAAARTQSANNLKQMGIAFHNYASTIDSRFPAAAIQDPQGRPVLSWRVALLPYIEADPLYRQFNLDQPWDGPANRPLLEPVPRLYVNAGREPEPGKTCYQVFVGPGTVFEEGKGLTRRTGPGVTLGASLTNIPDGTSNTILAVEAANMVEWTRPQDLPFDPKAPLPPLGAPGSRGFNVLMADGSVRFLPRETPEAVLKAAITRNGNETVPLP